MPNQNLQRARAARKDEFYTQLNDIQSELRYYKEYFKGKVVFCNCDDPYESNFFKYFALNFNAFGLKKLIATCYNPSPIAGVELNLFEDNAMPETVKKAYKIEITEVSDVNNDGAIDLADVEFLLKNNNNVLTTLNGSGDFRSVECKELLEQSDIVVTNPPFSLFREYVAQLIKYDKKFVILGNQNAITYKEIFQLIKENKIWLGSSLSFAKFKVPDYYEERSNRFWIDETGQKWRSFGNICWFTNLDIAKRHQDLILYRQYNSEEYPKYDNYDAINVNKVADIPCDYDGVMGVPITFLDKYNPEQFEIVDAREFALNEKQRQKQTFLIKDADGAINGKPTYARICIIRRKQKWGMMTEEASMPMAAEKPAEYKTK
ncbi:MAG: adenine-specific methyltransferase EcoRI family protein [Paludibacteraceae bacterium]|nr:adenine-specific methyltransferase EcoRI family protein [Paludibacteraceae bacterium]